MKSVLIVDDNEIDTLIHKKVLERIQRVREVHSASNGHAAIALLSGYAEQRKPLPDIILLDLNMPIMNGLAFIDKLKELELPGKEKVIVIIVSSSSSSADLRAVKEKGINLYVLKPLTEAKLLKALGMED
ncbi:MAG TPA: response regulator [Chryseolinea sp.]|nr:response regulator [Chryseolinea sp.]